MESRVFRAPRRRRVEKRGVEREIEGEERERENRFFRSERVLFLGGERTRYFADPGGPRLEAMLRPPDHPLLTWH